MIEDNWKIRRSIAPNTRLARNHRTITETHEEPGSRALFPKLFTTAFPACEDHGNHPVIGEAIAFDPRRVMP